MKKLWCTRCILAFLSISSPISILKEETARMHIVYPCISFSAHISHLTLQTLHLSPHTPHLTSHTSHLRLTLYVCSQPARNFSQSGGGFSQPARDLAIQEQTSTSQDETPGSQEVAPASQEQREPPAARKQFQPVGKNFGDGIQDALVRPGFYSNQWANGWNSQDAQWCKVSRDESWSKLAT